MQLLRNPASTQFCPLLIDFLLAYPARGLRGFTFGLKRRGRRRGQGVERLSKRETERQLEEAFQLCTSSLDNTSSMSWSERGSLNKTGSPKLMHRFLTCWRRWYCVLTRNSAANWGCVKLPLHTSVTTSERASEAGCVSQNFPNFSLPLFRPI